MKRQISLLLAVLLLLGTAPARAAEEPSFQVTEEESGLVLEMTGMEDAYCGIQFTVELTGTADASFEVDDALFRTRPSLYSTYVRNGASVTIYIVAKSPLNDSDHLRLGVLHTDASASTVSGIKLLTLEDLEGQTFGGGDLTVQPGTPTQPGGSDNSGTTTPPGPRPSGGGWSPVGGGSAGTEDPSEPSTDTETPEEDPSSPAAPVVLPFLDVPERMWYYEAVSYAYAAGLMNGVSAAAFDPEGFTTRGQIVTILHRLEGEPLAVASGGFTDVPAGEWYAAAVDWAAEGGIVDGFGDGRFGPLENVTREQLAAILCRYARTLGVPEPVPGDLTAFADYDKVSPWALEAMAWANGLGLINGKTGGLLDPTGNATRAEIATILMRFCESVLPKG